MENKRPVCVLTIAGSDSGSGAGVQADARTIHALGGFACMAITALTAQNPKGVRSWSAEKPAVIAAQIEAVLGRRVPGALPVRAIKTGLLPGAAAVAAIGDALAAAPRLPLVIDPVIGSTSGMRFLNDAGVQVLRERLLRRATVVTPNWPEAEALSGLRLKSYVDAERAAIGLATEYGCAVLLKGGHGPGTVCRDILVLKDGATCWFESGRLKTPNTHGTGCVLSAAITTELAKGTDLPHAVEIARNFLQASLRAHAGEKWGGAGPAFPG